MLFPILLFAPTEADAGHTSIFELRARNGSGTNLVAWRIHVPSTAEDAIALTEFLANPTGDPASPGFNPLGRTELPPKDFTVYDEFVELVNLGATALDLSGWTLGDASAIRHEFPSGTLLQGGASTIIYGGPLEGFGPSINEGQEATLWFPASAGAGLSLNNGGDSITLRNAAGDLVLRVVYAGGQLPTQGSMARASTGAAFAPQGPPQGKKNEEDPNQSDGLEGGFEFLLGGVDEFAGGGLFFLRERAHLLHQRGEFAIRPDPRAFGLLQGGEIGRAHV